LPLTDTKCRTLKPTTKPFKASDGEGLYLYVTPAGSKLWRMNYRFGGKAKTLSIGVYPQISLKEARQLKDEAKASLSEGKDPSTEKQRAKLLSTLPEDETFAAVAKEWLEQRRGTLSANYFKQLESTLQDDINPTIGKIQISQVTAPELLVALRKIEERGALDIARKARQCCGQIFRYAIAIGKAERDIAADLKGALKTRKVQNRAYLSESDLPKFLQRLSGYEGDRLTALALEFIVFTFVRTKELREAPWDEFDLENALWRIPPERMKMDRQHVVPLSRQAVNTLQAVHQITGHRKFVFPNSRTPAKPMSENTMLYAMYRLGYHSRATVHGFRATASTILHEHGFNSEHIELQLAHVEGNKVKAAYNHAKYLKERTAMMQWWADHLDTLRSR